MATFAEINALQNRLYNEMEPIHRTSNLTWELARKKASTDMITSGSEDFRALVEAMKVIGYNSILTLALNSMVLPSSRLPQSKVSTGSVLKDEIKRILSECHTSGKSIVEVEKEAKKKIVERYKLVKDAVNNQGGQSAIPEPQSPNTGQSLEIQPGKTTVVTSPFW